VTVTDYVFQLVSQGRFQSTPRSWCSEDDLVKPGDVHPPPFQFQHLEVGGPRVTQAYCAESYFSWFQSTPRVVGARGDPLIQPTLSRKSCFKSTPRVGAQVTHLQRGLLVTKIVQLFQSNNLRVGARGDFVISKVSFLDLESLVFNHTLELVLRGDHVGEIRRACFH